MARKPRTPRWLEAARRRKEPVPEGSRVDWLARALGRAGVMPRAEAEQAIREGRVEVDGRVEGDPFAPVYDLWSEHMVEDVPFYVELAREADGPVVELAVGTGRVARRADERTLMPASLPLHSGWRG